MDFVLRITLSLLYFFWLPAMLLGRMLGRDPLQSKKPQVGSFWIVRKSRCSRESYFTEESEAEGRPAVREGSETGPRVGSSPPVLAKVLRGIGKMFW
jgi:hypothetical protein